MTIVGSGQSSILIIQSLIDICSYQGVPKIDIIFVSYSQKILVDKMIVLYITIELTRFRDVR